MKPWSIRDEILAATHRWPEIILFCLIGSLLGVAIALLWPSPYRASSEVYVGISGYRSAQDRNASAFAEGDDFTNPDDYKNWQMADLNAVVVNTSVLKDTLHRLRQEDPYWDQIDITGLYHMLQVYWRNAGRWRFVVENPKLAYATQAASTWRDVAVEHVNKAVAHAQDTMAYDLQLQAANTAQAGANSRLAELEGIKDGLQEWQSKAGQWPAGEALENSIRIQLLGWSSSAVSAAPSWQLLYQEFPPASADPPAYQAWLEKLSSALEAEMTYVHKEITRQGEEVSQLEEQYNAASEKSLGLSPNLVVEELSGLPIEHTRIRPTGTLAIIGLITGLLAWIFVRLVRISRPQKQ